MSSIDPSLQSFVRKVHVVMVYRTLLKWSVVWLMVSGVVVLIFRFMGELPTNWWHWLLGTWIALAAAAWYRESQRQPDPRQLSMPQAARLLAEPATAHIDRARR